MLRWVQSQLAAVPFLLFWDRSQAWGGALAGMALPKVTHSPGRVWLLDVCPASSEGNRGQNTLVSTGITHPAGPRLVFQTEPQLRKRLGLLGIGNRSLLLIDQAIAASSFLRLTCQHISAFWSPLGHSGVQAPQPNQFSISWRRLPSFFF